jgi:hypothetical protein
MKRDHSNLGQLDDDVVTPAVSSLRMPSLRSSASLHIGAPPLRAPTEASETTQGLGSAIFIVWSERVAKNGDERSPIRCPALLGA